MEQSLYVLQDSFHSFYIFWVKNVKQTIYICSVERILDENHIFHKGH